MPADALTTDEMISSALHALHSIASDDSVWPVIRIAAATELLDRLQTIKQPE